MEISNVKTNPFAAVTKAEDEEEQEVVEEQTVEEAVQNPLEKGETDKVELTTVAANLSNTQIQDTVNRYIKEKIAGAADPKIAARLTEFLTNFDVEKFIRDNGKVSMAELYAIIYNQTADYE